MSVTAADVRARLAGADPLGAAHLVLGGTLTFGAVTVRIVEVEAYGGPADGPWPDPAAHSYSGPHGRAAVTFGDPGHLYVYRSYGIHLCMNITAAPPGTAAAVLLRAGEVLDGVDDVRSRRGAQTPADRLARGPGNLGLALGVSLDDNGQDVLGRGPVRFAPATTSIDAAAGPRVGITKNPEIPWRLWIPGSPAVSAFRSGARKRRPRP